LVEYSTQPGVGARAEFLSHGDKIGCPGNPEVRKMKSAKEKRGNAIDRVAPPPQAYAAKLSRRTATVKAWIETKAGAEGHAFTPRKNSPPLVVIYKVMGKVFAILSVRGVEDVILKCDPTLASVLRKDYTGVGHRSHLDRRFWISVRLDADVPIKEIRSLVSLSYALVCSRLTAKQRTALSYLAPSPRKPEP
jgi:predicted DNA-binding protein (MmcQ/YjbR family)